MTESAFHRRTLTTKGTPMELEKKLNAIAGAPQAMSEQQDAMAAEISGLKKAISIMAALVPATEGDAIAAWETAAALVGTATEQGEIPIGMQSIELETIREALAQMGAARRNKN